MVDEDKRTEARSDGQAIGTDPLRVLWGAAQHLKYVIELQPDGCIEISQQLGGDTGVFKEEREALEWITVRMRSAAETRRNQAGGLMQAANKCAELALLLEQYVEGGAS